MIIANSVFLIFMLAFDNLFNKLSTTIDELILIAEWEGAVRREPGVSLDYCA